jgi:uncharacterized protein involved in cysteine biosynthesis
VALEVADVRVVVRRQIADSIVDLCARVDDALCMMGESREVHAVLLALELLCVLSFLAVVDLKRVVVACYNGELARVVEVKGRDRRGAWTRRFESLAMVSTEDRRDHRTGIWAHS